MRALFVLPLAVLLSSQCTGQRIQTVEVGSSRYFISNVSPYSPTLNWFLAYEYCRNIGMELLALEQSEETTDLNAFLTENNYVGTAYWTSGNQLGSEMWLWMSTGQPFNSTFNFWDAGGPPLTKSQQSCMSTQDATWSPHNCMDSKAFVCEQTRCFYYNYVTNKRGSSQGNSTLVPGVTRVTNRPLPARRPIRLSTSTTSRSPPTSTQREREQTQQSQSVNPNVATTQAPTINSTNSSSVTLKQMTTPLLPQVSKFMPITEQVKTMPPTTPSPPQNKVMPSERPQSVKVMPANAQQQVKVMPAVRPIIDDPSIDTTNNEIVPTDPNLSLRLIQLPTREFTPGELKEDTEGAVNLMEILSRKETFSWALEEETTEQPSA